jgi:serine/threonine-protein kinase RsbW
MDQPDQVHLKKSTDKISIQAPSNCCYIGYIRSLVADLAREVGFPDDEVAKIEMVVDEACSNVVEHAYASQQEAPAPIRIWHWKRRDPGIQLDVRTERDRLVIEVNDHGRRFDFNTYRPTSLQERIGQMETGGYGVAIMREFMDEVQYTSSETSGNTLRLVKYLKKS